MTTRRLTVLTRLMLAAACVAPPALCSGVLGADPPKVFPVDPVALVGGQEQAGDPAYTIDRYGFRYTFVSAANRDAFAASPERYEVQFGGACAKMGPLSGDGSPSRYTVHDGRIFIFASDSCRATFLKNPAVRMDDPDPRPQPTEAQAAAGRAMLDRVIDAMGGAAKVDAVKTFTRTMSWEQASGNTTYKRRDVWSMALPDHVRIDDVWNKDVYGTVAGPRGGFFTGSYVRALHPYRTGAILRLVRHTPLVIVRSRGLDGFVVMDAGPGRVGDTDTQQLVAWIDGSATTLHLDDGGKVIAAEYRGRGKDQTVGTVLKRFTAWTTVDGVSLPTATQVWFNGERLEAAETNGWTWAINPALPADTFEPSVPAPEADKGG